MGHFLFYFFFLVAVLGCASSWQLLFTFKVFLPRQDEPTALLSRSWFVFPRVKLDLFRTDGSPFPFGLTL